MVVLFFVLFYTLNTVSNTEHSTMDFRGLSFTVGYKESYQETQLPCCFKSTYIKIGMIQRIAWSLQKDDIQIHEAVFYFCFLVFFKKKKLHYPKLHLIFSNHKEKWRSHEINRSKMRVLSNGTQTLSQSTRKHEEHICSDTF